MDYQIKLVVFKRALPFFFPPTTMPPKRRGVFLLPGTPASKKKTAPILVPAKSVPAPPLVTGDYSGKNGRYNIINEFQAEYVDPEKLRADLAALATRHLKPLAALTLKRYNRVHRLWLVYSKWLYGSAEKANATLAEDAKFPPAAEVKMFVGHLAKKGHSGLKMSLSGWSTARGFVLSIIGMVSCQLGFFLMLTLNPQRRRHHTEAVLQKDRDDLINVCAFFPFQFAT